MNPSDDLGIGSAVLADADALVALWMDCGLVVPHNDPREDFEFALNGPSSDVVVLRECNQIIGAVMVGHDGHRGWIYYLAVRPDRQKQGFGKRLTTAAEDWLRQRGVRKVMLMVRETNTKVLGFYERGGFVKEPRVIFSKWL